MLSQTAEYALRAMVFLASKPGLPQTTLDIARVTRVPAGYLSKILKTLVRAGLVSSRRGIHGGYVLQAKPREVSLLGIVNAVDPLARTDHCPLGNPSHRRNLCPLHRRLNEALASAEKLLSTSTLEDMIGQSGNMPPLCETEEMSPHGKRGFGRK
jgi:Rrf2 family protein